MMVSNWDKDKTMKNPYKEPVAGKIFSPSCHVPNLATVTGTTMTEVRLELANEENEDAARGRETLHEVSTGKWLTIGLDLEEQQCVSLLCFSCFLAYTLCYIDRYFAGKPQKKLPHLVPPNSSKNVIPFAVA